MVDKIQYLQIIQNVISRMSTLSSVMKGFCVTILIGIATLVADDLIQNIPIWLTFIPLLSLIGMDVYYLHLERLYRCLYEDVRTDKHPIDFSLFLSEVNSDTKWHHCLGSKSIIIFYIPLIVFCIIFFILEKWC